MIDAAGGFLVIALRFLAMVATTGALGAWIFARFVVAPLRDTAHRAQAASLQRLAVRASIWCTATLALTVGPRLLTHALAGPRPTGDFAAAMLATARSPWGWTLLAQGVAACVVCVVLMMNPRTPSWPRLADGATLVLAIAPPFLAHAGAATELRVVSIVVDIIHGLAAGGWVGALALLTTAIIRERHAPDGAARSAQLIAAFHPVALVAAGTVFATGLGTAWLRMGAPEGIASPTYSGLFVAKLLLAGVTGWIGAGHSKLATRRVASVEPRAVSRTLLTECLIAVCVLILTAVLVGTAPIG